MSAGLSYRSNNTHRSASSTYRSRDAYETLQQRKQQLTQELWNVMSDLEMVAAEKAGHVPVAVPSHGATLTGREAFLHNRFATTAQQCYNTMALAGSPVLKTSTQKYSRKSTDLSKFSEARAKAGEGGVDR